VVLAGGFAKQLPWLPHIPKRWRSFIRKLMADDPDDRYQNVDQIQTALASLPITPNWSCSHSPPFSKWERTAGSRRIEVTWEAISDRKHTWVARSLPVGGSGRPRTLAGSSGVVNRLEAVRGLEAFLLKAAK
jgi:serine/threonine protein kinase